MVAVARVVVKGLRRVAIVGDRFETHPVFRHFKDELPAVAAELEVIDLTGLPMAELRKRVAALPNDAAILYTSLFSEGARVYRRPVDALAMIAEVANRPIVISIETHLERGGIGGYFTIPASSAKKPQRWRCASSTAKAQRAFLSRLEVPFGPFSTGERCSDGASANAICLPVAKSEIAF